MIRIKINKTMALMLKKNVSSFAGLAVCALLSGCVFASTTGGIVGSALMGTQVSLAFSKKLPTDHLAESVTGLDCDFQRSLKDGGFLCRPIGARIVEAPLYCYRTLGRVDCYTQPLHNEASRLVE